MVSLDALIEPVSGPHAPCGPDLSYDPDFLALEWAARGVPASALGAGRRDAVAPDWPRVQTLATALLARSKDLRTAMFLARALLRTHGVPGLAAGLELLLRLVQQHGGELHPQDDGEYPAAALLALETEGDDGLAADLRALLVAATPADAGPDWTQALDALRRLEAAVGREWGYGVRLGGGQLERLLESMSVQAVPSPPDEPSPPPRLPSPPPPLPQVLRPGEPPPRLLPLDALCAPIDPAAPCGPDLSYDPAFIELELLLQPRPETQFSAAEPPPWPLAATRAQALLLRTHDLRPAVALAQAAAATHGLAGAAFGLVLVARLLAEQWTDLHPQLEADDDNHPGQRLAAIDALNSPLGLLGQLHALQARGDAFEPAHAAQAAAAVRAIRDTLHERLGWQADPRADLAELAAFLAALRSDAPAAEAADEAAADAASAGLLAPSDDDIEARQLLAAMRAWIAANVRHPGALCRQAARQREAPDASVPR